VGYNEGNMDEEFEVYETLGHALGHMEVPEVKEGYYRLFDSTARCAELGWSERHGWDVFIKAWSLPKTEELNSALRAHFVRTGQTVPDEDADFPAFMNESASIMRRLQEARKPRWIRVIGQGIQWVRRRTGKLI
jgi:hypothetical protein